MSIRTKLFLIVLAAFVFRVVLAVLFVRHPGIADPNFYYNMSLRLLDGQGFTTDFIWNYAQPPAALVHPEDLWMPLTAFLAALPQLVYRTAEGMFNPLALAPFIVIGSLLPLLSFWAARLMRLSGQAALYAAAVTAFIPELVLNSVRTDTTIPTAFLVGVALLAFTQGLRDGRLRWFVLAGVTSGLAYLTRNDALLLLPAFLVVTILAWWSGRRGWIDRPHWRGALLVPLLMALVVAPWLIRNLQEFGALGSAETRKMFFYADNLDHYAYGREFTLQTLLAARTPAELIGKRLFEFAAGVKLILETLGGFLAVAVPGGLLLLLARRDKPRLLAIALPLILLLGAFIAYPILIPMKAQAGSLKKEIVMLLPLLVPLGAYALQEAVPNVRLRFGAMVLSVALLAAGAFDLVRLDAATAVRYLASMQTMAAQAQTLPDVTGDGELVFMAQDPFMLRYVGLRSVMYPHEDLDTTLEVARRYGVDYLLFPADRPQFAAIQDGTATDPRLTAAGAVPGTTFSFMRVEP